MKENNTTKSIFVKKKTRHGIRYLAESFLVFNLYSKSRLDGLKTPQRITDFHTLHRGHTT